MMDLLLGALAVLIVIATALPVWKHEAWWVRVLDFPRVQIAVGGSIVTAAYVWHFQTRSPAELALAAVLGACTVYQFRQMLPYTPLFPCQVSTAESSEDPGPRVSILVANVLMDNREADRFVELVRSYGPDVVLTVETDQWWVDRLSALDSSYPYAVKVPLPNTYGMLLQSRLELVDSEVRCLVDDEIPSIHAQMRLGDGSTVRLHCLHPRPPAPTEDTDTIERDAELLIVGRRARSGRDPTIVMGDLNDVAWSHTTRLFQKISGLVDPRVGRGMYSTYHAGNPLLRWPLDHVFHSRDFRLVSIERLPSWGSDHFPIFVRLEYAPDAAEPREPPQPPREEREEAREKIEKARDG